MSTDDRVAGTAKGVNRESRFDLIRRDVERELIRDPAEVIFRLLGIRPELKKQPNGSFSITCFKCPWCGTEGDKKSSPLFLHSNCERIECMKCSRRETIIFIFFEDNALSLNSSIDACCERLSSAAGVNPYNNIIENRINDETFGEFVIDMDECVANYSQQKTRDASPTGLMPQERKDWITNGIKSFIDKAESGTLLPPEKAALQYVIKRGISQKTIIKCKLFIEISDRKTQVVLPSYGCDGELVGYQWFDYNETHKTGKAEYKACKKEYGSALYPFGIDTCIGVDGPIFMVCGFFDYLSAIEVGFKKVISPFGITMLSGGVDHIKDILKDNTVTILFDKKIQEFDQSLVIAEKLRLSGSNVNILLWMKGKEGFDFNDYMLGCISKGKLDPKSYIYELIGLGYIGLIKHGDSCDIVDFIKKSDGLMVDGYQMIGSWPNIKSNTISKSTNLVVENILSKFEPDLEKAIHGIDELDHFDTLMVFTHVAGKAVMCDTLEVKACGLKKDCSCVAQKSLDISDGRFIPAFINSEKISVESINITNTFLCPITNDKNHGKTIEYKLSDDSKVWNILKAHSLLSTSSPVSMVTRSNIDKPGIYRVSGFRSKHCGMKNPVYVINKMSKWSMSYVIDSLPKEDCEIVEYDFFSMTSSLMDLCMVTTPDITLISCVCAWAFSPSVIPLIKDIGSNIYNHLQPSLSLYIIGDSATGKTNTIKEVSDLSGIRCDPIDAKMATRAGLIIAGGKDGSPGQMVRCMGGYIGLDEITDQKGVLDNTQLLIENNMSLAMDGRTVSEIVPVRVVILSNADSDRKKLNEFRTPMEAASNLIKEHLIRRLDFCLATQHIREQVDIDSRNYNLYVRNSNINITREYLSNLGKRCRRQDPNKIKIEDDVVEFMSRESDIFKEFRNDRIGNPMMYEDMRRPVFRVACGIAGFSGSFDGEYMIVKLTHIMNSIKLIDEMMDTMGATTYANNKMKMIDGENGYKVITKICIECFDMLKSTDNNIMNIGRTIILFIQACNASDPGSAVNPGINEAFRTHSGKTISTSDTKIDPYKRAWRIIKRMRDAGLISSEKNKPLFVTRNFSRSISIMMTDDQHLYEKMFEYENKNV